MVNTLCVYDIKISFNLWTPTEVNSLGSVRTFFQWPNNPFSPRWSSIPQPLVPLVWDFAFWLCLLFICNYLLVNRRIAVLEERLEGFLRDGEKHYPNNSLDDQRRAHHGSVQTREKRSAKQQSQPSVADLEKRVKDLEKRLSLVIFHFSSYEFIHKPRY